MKQLFSELIASRQRYLSSTAIETKVDTANQFQQNKTADCYR